MAEVFIPNTNITFTNQRDTVTGDGDGDISGIRASSIVNTLGGDDTLTGVGTRTASYGIWIIPQGELYTSGGKDTIIGTANLSRLSGIFLDQSALLDTGAGADTIIGTSLSGSGIFLNAASSAITTIQTGANNDTVIGESTFDIGIDVNSGALETGDGNDTIDGTGSTGITLRSGGTIKTGNGNDTITGMSTSNSAVGIRNFGIANFVGEIDTGAGNDLVDARTGGFGGSGITNLGQGNDDLKGFGSGSFNGGSGKDTLELTTGTYIVGISGETVRFTASLFPFSIMVTTEFERLLAGNAMIDFTSLENRQTVTVV
jgi:hypothetical protein